MSKIIMNVRRRNVHFKDWSGKDAKVRHAIWCVAYRVIAKGEPKREAERQVSKALRFPLDVLHSKCKRTIRIEYPDHE